MTLSAAVLVAGCGGADAAPRQAAAPPEPTAASLTRALDTGDVVAHLRELEGLADANGGNRAAGTPGGERTLDLLAGRLRSAGYAVTEQPVPFPFFEERARPVVTIDGGAALPGIDTLEYSPGGEARGALAPVAGAGCARADHADIDAGEVAVVTRGTCTLRAKAELAADAGAAAVLIVNTEPGTFRGTLGEPGVRVPVLGTTPEAGAKVRAALGRPARVKVDATSERRMTRNVIAETRTGSTDGAIMLGAHADSVPEGPGINDNGTGVATLLTLAERLATHAPTDRRVRFGFWGAEEQGLYGSRRYVAQLDAAERRRLGAYLNLDMVGSRNPARLVYDGDGRAPRGSARIERTLRSHFAGRDLPVGQTGFRDGSDHAPFRRAGIPVGGLYTGAGEAKTRAQARRFGGQAGRPLDRCYHRACDRLAGVDRRILGQMGDAAAHALAVLARK